MHSKEALGAVARHKHPKPATAWESSAKNSISISHELKWKRNERIFGEGIKSCLTFTSLARDA